MTAVEKAPLVLLHGLGMSGRVWVEVAPLLAAHHWVITPTMLGHRGGPRAAQRPTLVHDLVDDVERRLDAQGLGRVHLAGNSLGGWVGIELARRGRATSVCALSPAGLWDPRTRSQTLGTSTIRREYVTARVARPLAPLALKSPILRRIALRNVATRGGRMSSGQAIDIVRDLVECSVIEDLLETPEQVEPLGELPCPITVAWSEHDRLLPHAVNGQLARERLPPETRFLILRGVGHVPMIDAPQLVAQTILESTAAATA